MHLYFRNQKSKKKSPTAVEVVALAVGGAEHGRVLAEKWVGRGRAGKLPQLVRDGVPAPAARSWWRGGRGRGERPSAPPPPCCLLGRTRTPGERPVAAAGGILRRVVAAGAGRARPRVVAIEAGEELVDEDDPRGGQ